MVRNHNQITSFNGSGQLPSLEAVLIQTSFWSDDGNFPSVEVVEVIIWESLWLYSFV